MQYRGIEYDIKDGLGGVWAWTVHTPKVKRGEAMTRVSASFALQKAIDDWCRKNAELCANRETQLTP